MLIATVTALIIIFVSGNLEFYLTNLKKPVKEHVADPVRREVVLDASKSLKKELTSLEKEVREHFEDVVEVHGEYDSTPADYDEAGEALKADQRRLSKLVLDARDAMHDQMTKEEWEAVFKAEE